MPIWDKDSREALYVRQLGRKTPQTYELYREFIDTRPPEIIANIAICLIHQTNYLIDRQLLRLEKDFLEQGGLRERMTRVRIAHRNAKPNKPTTDPPADLRQPNQPANAPTSPASHPSQDSKPPSLRRYAMSQPERHAKRAKRRDSGCAGQDAGVGMKPSEAFVEEIRHLIEAPRATGVKGMDLIQVYTNFEIGRRNRSPNCAIADCTIPGRIRGVV